MLDVLIDAAHQLEADASIAPRALAERDRAIGQTHGSTRGKPSAQLAAWVKAVQTQADGSSRSTAMLSSMAGSADDSGGNPGGTPGVGPARAASRSGGLLAGLWSVSMVLAGVGFVLGAAVVSVVLFYDGSQPVNITRALWVLVVLPLVLTLCATALVALTARPKARRLPPVRALSAVLSAVQVGAMWRVVRHVLPLEQRAVLDDALGRGTAQGKLHGAVMRWQVLRWSQVFVVCYQIGVGAGFLALITMEDRAFAWSTTLSSVDDAASRYHGWVQRVSLPWSILGSPWVPSLELVQATGFDRYAAETDALTTPAFDANASKAWWPFFLMAILVYGLLPRAVFWGVCVWSMRRAAERSLTRLPGIDRVLDRLNAPPPPEASADGAAGTAEAAARDLPATAAATVSAQVGAPPVSMPRSVVTLNWAEAPHEAKGAVFAVGGARSMAEDEQALDETAKRVQAEEAVGVCLVVSGWEPPLVELADLVKDLRRRLGEGPPIRVLLVGEQTKPEIWRRWVVGLQDPWTVLIQEGTDG